MKKFLCLALSILLVLSVASVVIADGNITVQIDGQPIGFDVPPQIMNGRTMVPLRAIFEALGATVDWNGDTQTVTSEKNGVSISLTINDPSMYVNGSEVVLDSPACITNGRTLVPVRAISEAFGTAVGWDGATSTVSISTSGNMDPAVTMYAADGRTIEIKLSEKEAYKAVGWYEQPVTTMYALDGRTVVAAKSEVEAYNQVGWYEQPVSVMYAADGRTVVVAQSEVEAYKAVGWYDKPVTTMYAVGWRTIVVAQSEVDAYKQAGWYTETEFCYPTNGLSSSGVKIPKFDMAVEGVPGDYKYYDWKPDIYSYHSDWDHIKKYMDLLEQKGWSTFDVSLDYETRIENNVIKRVPKSSTYNFSYRDDSKVYGSLKITIDYSGYYRISIWIY